MENKIIIKWNKMKTTSEEPSESVEEEHDRNLKWRTTLHDYFRDFKNNKINCTKEEDYEENSYAEVQQQQQQKIYINY